MNRETDGTFDGRGGVDGASRSEPGSPTTPPPHPHVGRVPGAAASQSNDFGAANPAGEEASASQQQQQQEEQEQQEQPLQPGTPHHRDAGSTPGQQQQQQQQQQHEQEEEGLHGRSQDQPAEQWELQRRRHRLQQRQRSVGVLSDLVFADAELEQQFRMEHARSQRSQDALLAGFVRGLVWASAAVKAVLRGRRSAAAWLFFFALPTGVFPLTAMAALPWEAYVRWREVILTCVNLLQYAQACYFYQYLFSSSQVPQGLVQTVGALVTGSALSWLYLTNLMGSLVFRWAFLAWFASVAILFHFNPTICATSQPLQQAYLKLSLGRARPLLIMLGLGLGGGSGRPGGGGTCPRLQFPVLEGGGERAAEAAAVAGPPSLEGPMALCLLVQPLVQLWLGYLLPSYLLLWRRELRQRQRFLAARGLQAAYGWPCSFDFAAYAVLVLVSLLSLASFIPGQLGSSAVH